MTRARAAAKANETTVKTTKIVTAAARARSTATAGTKSTAAKRKTRADEHDDDQEEEREVVVARRPRGRPKKTEAPEPEPEPEAPVRATRGRAVKKTAAEPSGKEPAPPKPARGRPRKVVAVASANEPAAEPVKKTTRTRAATTTKPTATKPALKKTVKFQEPDKENVEPSTETHEPVRGGMRGRPAKRGAAVGAARATRAAVRSATSTEKKALSPKKITQMPLPLDDESEDELAGDANPVKPMMKKAIKPPSSGLPKSKPTATEDHPIESTIHAGAVLNPSNLGASVVASPVRRPPTSPFKDSMRSPARKIGPVTLPGSTVKPVHDANGSGDTSPSKALLLQSAAKRPQSPIKGLNFGTSLKPHQQQSQSAMKSSLLLSPAKRAMPGLKPFTEPRPRDLSALGAPPAMKPLVAGTPTPASHVRPSDRLMMEDEAGEGQYDVGDDVFDDEPMGSLQFPGRLSAVLPRHADPALKKDLGIVDEPNQQENEVEESLIEEFDAPVEVDHVENTVGVTEISTEEPEEEAAEPTPVNVDAMAVDGEVEDEVAQETDDEMEQELEGEMAQEVESGMVQEAAEESISAKPSPFHSPVQEQNQMFQLRDKDLNPCHDMGSDSEDESTPAPALSTPLAGKTPKARGTAKSSRTSMGGFTALAERFGSWSASTPIKMAPLTGSGAGSAATPVTLPERTATPRSQASPAVTHFFEDEMTVRADIDGIQADTAEIEEPTFDGDMMVTDEDVALANEANEMSLTELDEVDEILDEAVNNDAFDDTLSEASQEYGDENEVPFDPAMASKLSMPATPVRPVMKTFNTTTKIPLKPADDSTPTPLKKRSFSASRVAPKRPSGPARSATVISYSPVKDRKSLPVTVIEPSSSAPATPAPVTPTKSDLWSSIGTPARTPRRDVNPALLSGAVVFVDVHTSEGADASSIFVELLTQMGAKCMKTWNWDFSAAGNDGCSSKVGITHVVFKDGDKKTLNKVRESNGLVQCVGVSWVLE